MDTEFEELTIENFGPFLGKHKIRLSHGGSLVFVRGQNKVEPSLGSNGAGKSKLLNGLVWCLYGKTSDELASPDIRPWHGGKKDTTSAAVKLTTWEGKDGLRHTVKRTASPNALTIDGKAVSQSEVDSLIGMSFDVFRLAIFLGQGQPLFHDLPNREKLDFLSGVLGLDRWDEYSERAKRKADGMDGELQKLDSMITANAIRVEELKGQVNYQKIEVDRWEGERDAKLKDTVKALKALAKEVDAAGRAHGDVNAKLDGAGLRLKQDEGDVLKLSDELRKAEQNLNRLRSHHVAVTRDLERAHAELTEMKEQRTCPTCGQPIKRQSMYLNNVEVIKGRIADYTKELNDTAVQSADKACKAAQRKYDALTKAVKQQRDAVAELGREERLLARQKLEYELKYQQLCDVETELEQGENPHRGRLAELKKALRRANDDAEAAAAGRDKLEGETARVRYWVKGFKDVRLSVLEDVLGELEFTTNAMLETVGLVGWEVKYAVERETKSGTIQRGLITTVLNPAKTDAVKWKSWSGGEGQRLRIAGALALSDVVLARAGVQCNLAVLDEPSRGLSDEGVDDLVDCLGNLARNSKRSLFLVDHMAMESTRFDRVVTVRKTDKGSEVIIGHCSRDDNDFIVPALLAMKLRSLKGAKV